MAQVVESSTPEWRLVIRKFPTTADENLFVSLSMAAENLSGTPVATEAFLAQCVAGRLELSPELEDRDGSIDYRI